MNRLLLFLPLAVLLMSCTAEPRSAIDFETLEENLQQRIADFNGDAGVFVHHLLPDRKFPFRGIRCFLPPA